MNTELKQIINNFKFIGTLSNIEENKQGNINKTYILTYKNKNKTLKYLLQEINANVFKEPDLVMHNIELVTNHINKKLKSNKDTTHKTLTIIKTLDDKNMYVCTNNNELKYYRAFDFIENCISYDSFKDSKDANFLAYNAGKSFGYFQALLKDFNPNLLHETINDFHNIKKRFNSLLEAIENKITNRASLFSKEIIDLMKRIKEYSVIVDKLGSTIPIRVTHNDTKLNNILMNKDTNEGIAIIDLDTVMPGSILYDIGDGIRSACANSFEDETDKEKIYLNLDLTKSYLKGFLEETYYFLTDEEIKYIGLSIKILTYELALRFLTDYLNGDIYFKIKYLEHNKDRFLNQYILLLDLDKKIDEIDEFVLETIKELKK